MQGSRHSPWTLILAILVLGAGLALSGCRPQAEQTAAAATRESPPAPQSPLPAPPYFHDSAFLNLEVPAGWRVVDATGGQSLTLEPESPGAVAWSVEVAFLEEEISAANTLEAWYPAYRLKAGAPITEMEVLKSTQRYDSAGDNTRLLAITTQTASGPEQVVLRTNFNLVLSISATSADPAARAMVDALAESLGFHRDAPRNLLHLRQRAGAAQEPVNLSSLTVQRWGYMESWPRYEVTIPLWDWWYGGDAVLHRTIPGCKIDFVAFMGMPGYFAEDAWPFLRVIEFEYRELGALYPARAAFIFEVSIDALASYSDKGACRAAANMLLDTVQLAPSGIEPSSQPQEPLPSPTEAHVNLLNAAVTVRPDPDNSEYLILNARSSYGTEPRFEVRIASAEWERDGTILTHRQIVECRLNIAEGGRGMATPGTDSALELAGSTWFVRDFPDVGYTTWTLAGLKGVAPAGLPQYVAYLFGLTYGSAAGSADALACRAAVHELLATFDLPGWINDFD